MQGNNTNRTVRTVAFNQRFIKREARESMLKGTELHYSNRLGTHGSAALINMLRRKEA